MTVMCIYPRTVMIESENFKEKKKIKILTNHFLRNKFNYLSTQLSHKLQ